MKALISAFALLSFVAASTVPAMAEDKAPAAAGDTMSKDSMAKKEPMKAKKGTKSHHHAAKKKKEMPAMDKKS